MQYIHWLKIDGTVSDRDEARQYREIQSYLDRYPGSTATMFMYELHLFHRVVKLECNQNWDDLDLSANTMSHALRRLSRKPDNLIKPRPFKTPERVLQSQNRNDRGTAR